MPSNLEKLARALTSRKRNSLPDGSFVFPTERRYPIHDEAHARNALARASGKPEEARVRNAVHARYPDIGADKTATDADSDERLDPGQARRLRRRFGYWSHKLRTKGVLAGTYHKRVIIPKSRLPEEAVKQLGFEPVAIAIPEAGQDSLISYRHPDNLFHIHSHGDKWTMHEDSHPSLTMALRKAKWHEVPQAVVSGLTHVVTEGIPGAYKYISHRLTGAGNMLDAVMRDTEEARKARRRGETDAAATLGLA